MPFSMPSFPLLSAEQASPYGNLINNALRSYAAAMQAKYIGPMAETKLQSAQQHNLLDPEILRSQIALRNAQAANLGQETNKINYLLKNPGFMGGPETRTIAALRQMGLVDQNYQPNNNFQSPVATDQHAQNISDILTNQNKLVNGTQNQQSPNFSTSSPTQGFNVGGLVQSLINKPMSDLQYKQTLTKVMQQNLAGKPYTTMPAVEKEYAISQARSFGYSGEQASKLFNQGYDLASMAQAKGYNGSNPSEWPIARGAPTTAIQTRIQRSNSTMSALDAVEPSLASAYAQYAPRFRGVSPALIKDMVTGDNPEQQAEAFAAYALYPELQSLRINAQGGNVGEGAIQHMADASFSRFNTLGLSPNSHVYKLAMKRVNDYIRQMNRAENAAVYRQTNASYEDDDRAAANADLSSLSDAELQKIAGGK